MAVKHTPVTRFVPKSEDLPRAVRKVPQSTRSKVVKIYTQTYPPKHNIRAVCRMEDLPYQTVRAILHAAEGVNVVAYSKDARLPRVVTKAHVRTIVTGYPKGKSIRSLAEKTGLAYATVHRVLSDAGIPLRARGGSYRCKEAKRG